MTRLKLAELTSGVGALVLGVGFGALVPEWFSGSAALIVITGVATHALGMWDKHRLETQEHVETGRLIGALYWACWLLLAGVIVFLFVER